MRSRHLIDPELVAGLAELRERPVDAGSLDELRMQRAAEAAQAPRADPQLASVTVHQVGAISVRVFTPVGGDPEALHPAYLHLHGGGYVMGSAEGGDAEKAALAAELACVVASVAYRLAPESPHPGPVEDAYAALVWLHGQAEALRVDRGRIAIGGESAGGGLAAALALLARDRGEVAVVFQYLMYPMLDDRTVTAALHPFAGELVWTRDDNRFGWTSLLGGEPGGADVSPYAAAARAEDLAGLPPAFIAVGALDLFIDEDIEYARRLIRAGVPTELHVFPGAYHAFDQVPNARSAAVARNRARSALRGALHPRVARAV
jgi:acetyl esterase/lipase